MCGFYKLAAVNAKTGKTRVLADWFPYLITDIGLDYLATHYDFVRYCYVGSGSTTPTFADIGLGNHVATFDSTQYLLVNDRVQAVNSTSPYYRYCRGTYRFPEGAAAGNLSEVGVGWGSNHAGSTFSRALILDTYGNPTTITVLSDEYLDVTYEYRLYPNETDVTGSLTFTGNKGATYSWTIRPGNITYLPLSPNTSIYFPRAMTSLYAASMSPGVSESDIGTITSILASGNASAVYSAYVNGNHYVDCTITVALTQGNFATGIHKFGINICGCGWQIGIASPYILKTSSDIVTITLRVSWARV